LQAAKKRQIGLTKPGAFRDADQSAHKATTRKVAYIGFRINGSRVRLGWGFRAIFEQLGGSMGTLHIRRPTAMADWLRKYRIIVDNTEVGAIGSGSDLQVELPAGPHLVRAKVDWCSSNVVSLDVGEKSWHELEVGSNLRGWRLLQGYLYVTIWRSHYLYLRPGEAGERQLT
jgi:hypothetical protein